MSRFPYGPVPLLLLVLALLAGLVVAARRAARAEARPDLVLATFGASHHENYLRVIPEFERLHGVRVQVQLVNKRALQSRLQSALLAGVEVPDLVELSNPSIGYFTRGRLEDVGLVDLTERVRAERIDERVVASRFGLWSSRGRIFAIPHDVHPLALAYRADLVAELGIDVEGLRTWDDFAAMGRALRERPEARGRFAIDLPTAGADVLVALLAQRGVTLFDPEGRLTSDEPRTVETILWYVRQTRGPEAIAFPGGWGQAQARTMIEGVCLFYLCADWRSKQFEHDVPSLHGKLALMPLPAWEPGGRRTSTWGGAGIALTKGGRNHDLAWELAKFLYFNEEIVDRLFLDSNIIPTAVEHWDRPVLDTPNPFYGGQAVGRFFVELASEVPPDHVSAYTELAIQQLSAVVLDAGARFEARGEEGLREFTEARLARAADYVRRIMARNVFQPRLAADAP
jgi:arabinosaccharide transport system substrate-binding protein